MKNLKHASLFSGIGGFDIAAKSLNIENVFNCEIEEYPRKILKLIINENNDYIDLDDGYVLIKEYPYSKASGTEFFRVFFSDGKKASLYRTNHTLFGTRIHVGEEYIIQTEFFKKLR